MIDARELELFEVVDKTERVPAARGETGVRRSFRRGGGRCSSSWRRPAGGAIPR